MAYFIYFHQPIYKPQKASHSPLHTIFAHPIRPTQIIIGILITLSIFSSAPLTAQSLDGTPLSTIELAKMWIHGRIPKQSLIAMEAYTPDLDEAHFYMVHLPLDINTPEIVSPFYNLEWYHEFDYIMTSAGVGERYRANPKKFARQNQFYDTLQESWTLAAKFVGPNLIGSEIRIYKNPDPPSTPEIYSPELYATLEGAPIAVARDLLSQLARLYRSGGWHPKAIDIYQHLLLVVPNHPDFYAELATSYYAMDLKSQAVTAYKHALKQDSTNVAILTNLGTIHFEQNDLTQAATFWERASDQRPDDIDHINNLLFIYAQQNRPDRAIKLLQKAKKHHPDNTEIISTLESLTQ